MKNAIHEIKLFINMDWRNAEKYLTERGFLHLANITKSKDGNRYSATIHPSTVDWSYYAETGEYKSVLPLDFEPCQFTEAKNHLNKSWMIIKAIETYLGVKVVQHFWLCDSPEQVEKILEKVAPKQ